MFDIKNRISQQNVLRLICCTHSQIAYNTHTITSHHITSIDSVKVEYEKVHSSCSFVRLLAQSLSISHPFQYAIALISLHIANIYTIYGWACNCRGNPPYILSAVRSYIVLLLFFHRHVSNQPKHVKTWMNLFSCCVFWFHRAFCLKQAKKRYFGATVRSIHPNALAEQKDTLNFERIAYQNASIPWFWIYLFKKVWFDGIPL